MGLCSKMNTLGIGVVHYGTAFISSFLTFFGQTTFYILVPIYARLTISIEKKNNLTLSYKTQLVKLTPWAWDSLLLRDVFKTKFKYIKYEYTIRTLR